MTVEEYRKKREVCNEEIRNVNKKLSDLRAEFIESNKPCKVDDEVEIILSSGKKVTGKAKTFRILQDGNVYVDCYETSGQRKYISTIYRKLTIL